MFNCMLIYMLSSVTCFSNETWHVFTRRTETTVMNTSFLELQQNCIYFPCLLFCLWFCHSLRHECLHRHTSSIMLFSCRLHVICMWRWQSLDNTFLRFHVWFRDHLSSFNHVVHVNTERYLLIWSHHTSCLRWWLVSSTRLFTLIMSNKETE